MALRYEKWSAENRIVHKERKVGRALCVLGDLCGSFCQYHISTNCDGDEP